MAKVAFVSFASGNYSNSLKDFVFSVRRFGYDVYTYSKFEEVGSPKHKESPYEFKLHAIRTVYQKGYDIVIWCDSAVRLLHPIKDWIPQIEKEGVYLQGGGCIVGNWTNDRTLEEFNITRDEAMNLPTAYACIMGFDFRHPITKTFLYKWKECADKGLFKGNWSNEFLTESQDLRCRGHRHDQSCAELVALKLNIPISQRIIFQTPEPNRLFITTRYA
jgi:hypothetical protein